MAEPAAATGILAVAVAAKSPGEVFLPQEDRLGRGWWLVDTQEDAGHQLEGEPFGLISATLCPVGWLVPAWARTNSGYKLPWATSGQRGQWQWGWNLGPRWSDCRLQGQMFLNWVTAGFQLIILSLWVFLLCKLKRNENSLWFLNFFLSQLLVVNHELFRYYIEN